MPSITLPTFTTGTPVASDINDALYRGERTPASVGGLINGCLDKTNKATLSRRDIRPGTFLRTYNAGSSTALDYYADWFTDLSTLVVSDSRYIAIPGAGCSFYLPWDATAVELSWAIAVQLVRSDDAADVTPASVNSDGLCAIQLFVDDEPTDLQVAIWRGANSVIHPAAPSDPINNYSTAPDMRYWETSVIIDSDSDGWQPLDGTGKPLFTVDGWHSAGLRVVHAEPVGLRVCSRYFSAKVIR